MSSNFIKVTVTIDTSQFRRDIDSQLRELGPAKYFSLKDTADFFVAYAQKTAHVITGNTRDSINIVGITGDTATIEAEFGAYWEEQRGGTHNFMTQAAEASQNEMTNIVRKYYDKVMRSGINR